MDGILIAAMLASFPRKGSGRSRVLLRAPVSSMPLKQKTRNRDLKKALHVK